MKKEPSATHHQRIQAAIQERREHERQELRQLILKAAGELFLEVGYEQFSVRRLAERIGYETIPKWGQTACLMKSILPQKEGSVEVLKQVERVCSATKRSVCPRSGTVSYKSILLM